MLSESVLFRILVLVLIVLLESWVVFRGIGAAGIETLASWRDSARYALVVVRTLKLN